MSAPGIGSTFFHRFVTAPSVLAKLPAICQQLILTLQLNELLTVINGAL
jgi:hypothetical protein